MPAAIQQSQMESDRPVSYTHLDVYKRQLYNNSQLGNASNVINLASVRANLQKSGYTSNPYVDKTEISSSAMELFQRDMDINKFTKIATSDKEDTSHIERVKELFKEGVVDVYEDDVFSSLVTNQKLWDDLSL